MTPEKAFAVLLGSIFALTLAWQGIDYLAENGLTFSEWAGSILLAVAFGLLLGIQAVYLQRWLRKKGYGLFDDDDD